MPLNAAGLPTTDPMALASIFQLGRWDEAGQMTSPSAGPLPGPPAGTPAGTPPTVMQDCQVFCLGQLPEAPPPALPPNPLAPGLDPQPVLSVPDPPSPLLTPDQPRLGPAPGPAG